jgi:hypothetical protein
MRTFAVRHVLLSICFVALCLLSAPIQAAQVVSNLGDANQVDFGIQTPTNATAGSFTTAAGAYTLNSISVEVNTNEDIGDSSEMLLRTDSSGSPGALIENLGTITFGQGQSLVTYSSIGTLLSPHTTYWVTMGEMGSGFGQWAGTESTLEASPVSWTIGDQTFQSQDQGATWHQANFGPPNSAPLFSVDASLVPEPSSLALAAFGFAGLAAWGWRRRKRLRD